MGHSDAVRYPQGETLRHPSVADHRGRGKESVAVGSVM